MPNTFDDDALPPGTVLESNEEIRRAQEAIRAQQNAKSKSTEKPFRPLIRPPVAILTVLDDGSSKGEKIRIRDERFTIGRTTGELQLGFDGSLSSAHLAIKRRRGKESWQWIIQDLNSSNGVFFRVAKAPLVDKTEFLIGRGCYKFEKSSKGKESDKQPNDDAPATKMFQLESLEGIDSISEVIRGGQGNRINLIKSSYSIGTDQKCDIVRVEDPCTSGLHAKLNRSDKGTWVIENNGARNGVWVRLDRICVRYGNSCEFQAGEQRFKLSSGNRS
jgi:pSer/pThr/pTyr-binding forkhead associated (FHA) protein